MSADKLVGGIISLGNIFSTEATFPAAYKNQYTVNTVYVAGNLTLDGVKITAQAGPALYVSDPASTITIKSSELKSYADSTKFDDYDVNQIYGGYAVCFASWHGKIIAEDSKFTSEANHAIYFDVDTQTASENKFTNCRVVSKNGNALSIHPNSNNMLLTGPSWLNIVLIISNDTN